MLEIKNNNVIDYRNLQKVKGSGKLGTVKEYLTGDTTGYYYNKFKQDNNPYLNNNMWNEAARRGEINQLIANIEKATNDDATLSIFTDLQKYGDRMDYDTYMLALAVAGLDNETEDEIKASDGTVIGNYTKKQYAMEVLKQTQLRWDAEIIEEKKQTLNWFVEAGATIASGINHVASGALQFGQDIVNLVEGIGNVITGKDFLAAFADDKGEMLADLKQIIDTAVFEFEREYTHAVDAVDAYEQGYVPGTGSNMWEISERTQNLGVGYSSWGKAMVAITDSIGYMLPSMLITFGTSSAGSMAFGSTKSVAKASFGKTVGKSVGKSVLKNAAAAGGMTAAKAAAIKSRIFYTGVFSGMVGDTVKLAEANGISYKDLNVGQVIGNAALKTLAQVGVEKALGAILGFSALDRLMGATAKTGSGITKLASQAGKTGAKAAGIAIARGAKDMAKEGLEEFLQDMSDGLIDIVTGGIYAERGLETISMQNLVDSFVIGALTSGLIGAIKSASVVLPKNRAYALDENGKAYRMGMFQTLNYIDAMRTMSDWNEVLRDRNASLQEKADAAFKLNVVASSIGNILKHFGTERSRAANLLLNTYQNKEHKYSPQATDAAKQMLSDVGFAKQIFKDFENRSIIAELKYNVQKLQKAKKAAEKVADKLKASNTTNVENIITNDSSTNTSVDVSNDALTTLKKGLKAFDADIIVGTDGNAVVKSGDVVFAPNSLVKNGNISEILKGIAYESLLDDATVEISKLKIFDFIKKCYKEASGSEEFSNQQVVAALLFDQNFYLFTLLRVKENFGDNDFINSLSLINLRFQTANNKASSLGGLAGEAYNKLLGKIRTNMRNALVTFATQYTRINLDNVDTNVLPNDLKRLIKEHVNVVTSNKIDNTVKAPKVKEGTQTRAQWFKTQISKFVGLDNGEYDDVIKQAMVDIESTTIEKRRDAAAVLVILMEYNSVLPAEKQVLKGSDAATYLPVEVPTDTTFKTIRLELENETGLTLNELRTGIVNDASVVSDQFKKFMAANNYSFDNKEDRISAVRQLIYTKSGGRYTMSSTGEILEVMSKTKFMKPEYANDDKKLLADIKSGKVMSVKDVLKPGIKLSPEFKNIPIIRDINVKGLGRMVDGAIRIGTGRLVGDTIMHELTHGTQEYVAGTIASLGGDKDTFSNMPKDEKAKLKKHIEEHFPLANRLLGRLDENTTEVKAYHLLDGELQACSNSDSVIFECGFKLSKDRTTLYAPNGQSFYLGDRKTNTLINTTTSHGADRSDLDRNKALSYLSKLMEIDAKARVAKEDAKRERAAKYANPVKRITNSKLENEKIGEALSGEVKRRYLSETERAAMSDALTKQNKPLVDKLAQPITKSVNTGKGYSETVTVDKFSNRLTKDVVESSAAEKQGAIKRPSPLDRRYKNRYSYGTITAELSEQDRVNKEDAAKNKKGKSRIITKGEYDANAPYESEDWRAIKQQIDQREKEMAEYEKALKARERAIKRGEKRLEKLEGEAKRKYESAVEYAKRNRKPINKYDYLKTPEPRFASKEQMINSLNSRDKNVLNMLNKPTTVTNVYDNGEGYSKITKSKIEPDTNYNKAYVSLSHGHLGTKALKDLTAGMNISKALKNSKSAPETKRISRAEKLNQLLEKVVQMKIDEQANDFEEPLTNKEIVKLRKRVHEKLSKMSDSELTNYYNSLFRYNRDSDGSARRPFRSDGKEITVSGEEESRIRNWHLVGKQTRVPSELYNFVEHTHKDFNKLDKFIKDKIESTELTDESINWYVGNAKTIGDYTFEALNKYFYMNPALIDVSFEDMVSVLDNLDSIIAAAQIFAEEDPTLINRPISIDDMLWMKDTVEQLMDKPNGSEVKAKYEAYKDKLQSLRKQNKTTGKYFPIYIGPSSEYSDLLHRQFVDMFDSTIHSLSQLLKLGRDLSNKGTYAKSLDANDGSENELKSDIGDVSGMETEDAESLGLTTYNTTKDLASKEGGFIWNVNKSDVDFETAEQTFEDYINSTVTREEKEAAVFKRNIKAQLKKAEGSGKTRASIEQELKTKIQKLTDEKLTELYMKTLSKKVRTIEEQRMVLATAQAEDEIKYFNEERDSRISEEERTSIILDIYEELKSLSDEEVIEQYEQLADKYPDLLASPEERAYLEKKQKAVEELNKLSTNKRAPRVAPTPYGQHASRQSQINSLYQTTDTLVKHLNKSSNPEQELKNMPDDVRALISRKAKNSKYFVVNKKAYANESQEYLEQLNENVKATRANIVKNNSEFIKEAKSKKQQNDTYKQKYENTLAELQKTKKALQNAKRKKGLAVIDVANTVTIENENFVIDSKAAKPPKVQQMLSTNWDKTRESTVQGLSTNKEYLVKNGETFYQQNAELLLGLSLSEAESYARWFMTTEMLFPTSEDGKPVLEEEVQNYEKFQAIRFYFMCHMYRETRPGGQFENISPNVKQDIERFMHNQVHMGATFMGMYNGIKDKLNPIQAMFSSRLEIAGVELTRAEQDSLIEAAESNDINKINEIQAKIIERIKAEKTSKKTIGKTILTVRNMSMLSSPLTWLRNIISNFMLKRLNKLSAKIGAKIWTSKTDSGQLKMNHEVTPEITKFITEHFVDNGLFDSIVSNLSKYNPSDIQNRFKTESGAIDKRAIFANMVIKSMYNKFYNENMFDGKLDFMNKVHGFLMKALSDNNYVREACLRYFGQIIAENNYDLSEGVTDKIMTDFANSVGMAMSDYMHSDNFLNSIERVIAEKGEKWHFAYKLVLPFAATSWNWMKAALRYSPVGLLSGLKRLWKLEKSVSDANAKWLAGKSQVTPEMTEYLIRRDIGSGVIGTIAMLFGIMLAALGAVKLEDDDYGKPKLRIGSLEVDVSQVFGTSSMLAGAALVSTIKDGDGFVKAMDNTLDVMLDGFFLTDIMNLDLYSGGGTFATGIDFLESTLLSFIPNALAYVAGATYTGDLKKTKLWHKAVAKIPGFANFVPKKVNPYTGETGGGWDLFNRVVPYFDIKVKSNVESMSEAVGLNKTQLTGKYTINDKEFELSPKETAEINKQYGKWNASALTDFYSNTTRHRVKVGNTYQMLSYDQMTDAQRKSVANNIMANNASYAKIAAWLSKGNKYYASEDEYITLKQLGVNGQLYRGNKGFVEA